MSVSKLPYRPCVGLMVLNRVGHVWIGRRSGAPVQDPPRGWWQMPQGGIDDGEVPAAAALRELAEETGITNARIIGESQRWHSYDLPLELQRRVWGGRYRGQTQKWFAIRFEGDDSEVDIYPEDHMPEFDSWRWAPLSELMGLVVPFKRDVYRQVIDEFRDLAGPADRG
jgi:putative (di)nucleoside polyphosphate hydrolase